MAEHKFRIVAGPLARNSSIEMDGAPLHGVRRVSFDLSAEGGGFTVVKLEIIGEVEVDGEFHESAMIGVDTATALARRGGGSPAEGVIYELDEAAGDRIEAEYEDGPDGQPRKLRTRVVRVSGAPTITSPTASSGRENG